MQSQDNQAHAAFRFLRKDKEELLVQRLRKTLRIFLFQLGINTDFNPRRDAGGVRVSKKNLYSINLSRHRERFINIQELPAAKVIHNLFLMILEQNPFLVNYLGLNYFLGCLPFLLTHSLSQSSNA